MFNELVSLLFFSRDYAHRAHLRTTSYAAHMALDTFYKELPDLVDQLVEAYQGQYQLIDIPFAIPEEAVGEAPSVQAAIDMPIVILEHHLKLIQGTREQAVGPDSSLQNVVDEIVALYRSTLYKLRFLK